MEHPADGAERAARVIARHDVRQQQNAPAESDHAKVELVVLVADHFLVEHPDAVEQLPPETAERYRVHPAGSRDADTEIGVPHAEGVRECEGDSARGGRVGGGKRDDDSADIVGPRLLQGGYEPGHVVSRVDAVGVHADDHVARRGANRRVQGGRRDAGGVVEQPDARVTCGTALDDLAGPILAAAVGDEHFHAVQRVIRGEDRVQAGTDVRRFVPARHHDRHAGTSV